MSACDLEPEDKKKLIGDVGDELVREHGKKKYYDIEDIGRAALVRGYPAELHSWVYCIFSSQEAFDAIHDAAGKTCDYVKMKAEVLTDLSSNGMFQWLDIDLSWLDWPDIDVSFILEWWN